MYARLADHVMDERDLIDDITERGYHLAQLLPGLAVGFELPDGLEPRTQAILERFDMFAELGRLPVLLHKFRLEVEQINVAGPAGHEELHDPLRPGLVVQPAIGSLRSVGEERTMAKQRREGDAAKPAARVPEEITPVHAGVL